MLSEADLLDALRACFDTHNPLQRPVDIVSLGLVESIHLTPDPDAPGAGISGVPARQRLSLTLLSPTPDPDARAQLHAQVANRLAGLPQLSRVTLHASPTPWTPDHLTPALRRELHPPFPILNNRTR